MNIFYIYCHRKKTNGECFYIGKGKGIRYKTKYSRNKYWWNIVNKYGFESEILISNISEEKAFELESYFCNQIGYENLCNLRKETGWGGWSHSEETKQTMSTSHSGKEKPWVRNFRLGKKESEGTKIKKRGPKSEEHKQNLRESLKGNNKGRIITWNVGRKKGQKSSYDYSQRKMDYSNVGAKGKKLLQIDLKENLIKIWDSKNQASRELKINKVSIGNVCLGKQKTAGGFIWRYA
jgi:hypothetical protein